MKILMHARVCACVCAYWRGARVAFHGMCLCRVEQTARAAKYGATKGAGSEEVINTVQPELITGHLQPASLHYYSISTGTFAYSSRLLTEAVDHKWQPYAAWRATLRSYCCNTKKPRKMETISAQNEAAKPIGGSALIDSASAPLIERASFTSPGCGASLTSGGGGKFAGFISQIISLCTQASWILIGFCVN